MQYSISYCHQAVQPHIHSNLMLQLKIFIIASLASQFYFYHMQYLAWQTEKSIISLGHCLNTKLFWSSLFPVLKVLPFLISSLSLRRNLLFSALSLWFSSNINNDELLKKQHKLSIYYIFAIILMHCILNIYTVYSTVYHIAT